MQKAQCSCETGSEPCTKGCAVVIHDIFAENAVRLWDRARGFTKGHAAVVHDILAGSAGVQSQGLHQGTWCDHAKRFSRKYMQPGAGAVYTGVIYQGHVPHAVVVHDILAGCSKASRHVEASVTKAAECSP